MAPITIAEQHVTSDRRSQVTVHMLLLSNTSESTAQRQSPLMDIVQTQKHC
jgi:hypothetical protein